MGLSVRNEPISQRPAKAIARVQQDWRPYCWDPKGPSDHSRDAGPRVPVAAGKRRCRRGR
jgi:hypothetical protein